MTPEALRDYIVDKGFSEDVAQEVVVRYLRAKHPINHPKAWAWKTCIRLKYKWARQLEKRNISGVEIVLGSLHSDDSNNPLKLVIIRQELARVMVAGTPDPSRRRPWGWGRYREDYAALQKITYPNPGRVELI